MEGLGARLIARYSAGKIKEDDAQVFVCCSWMKSHEECYLREGVLDSPLVPRDSLLVGTILNNVYSGKTLARVWLEIKRMQL